MLLHVVSQDVGMPKISPVHWTETRLSNWETRMSSRETQWRLANQGPVPVLRDYVHTCIHRDSFQNTRQGHNYFWIRHQYCLACLKALCFNQSVQNRPVFFLSWARTLLPTEIFFCKIFSSSSIALIMFRLEDFSSFLRM